jgi:hypothetical protein
LKLVLPVVPGTLLVERRPLAFDLPLIFLLVLGVGLRVRG